MVQGRASPCTLWTRGLRITHQEFQALGRLWQARELWVRTPNRIVSASFDTISPLRALSDHKRAYMLSPELLNGEMLPIGLRCMCPMGSISGDPDV